MMGGIASFYERLLGIACHFGWTNQVLKFIEEECECTIELVHCFFSSKSWRRYKFIEELADVYVIMNQLPILLDDKYKEPTWFEMFDGSRQKLTHQELFWKLVDFKIKRTEDRIQSGYYDKEHE